MKSLADLLSAIVILVLSALAGGFVFMQMWHWFIVPTFRLEDLKYVNAIGVSYFVGYIMTRGQRKKKKKEGEEGGTVKKQWESFANAVGLSAVLLGIGWVLYQFM